MDPITKQGFIAAAGGGADESVYVEDVFSTHLYDGTGSTQTITNGLDLSGEGGMVWMKGRETAYSNRIYDTERGVTKELTPNSNSIEYTVTDGLTHFLSNGFTIGSDVTINKSGSDNAFVSWAFRKAPGFFDVVTYTGNGSGQAIPHNLGSVPGFIIVKRLDVGINWIAYHRSTGPTKRILFDTYLPAATHSTSWNDTSPTASNFYVGTSGAVNSSGASFVAYLFAHDDQSFGTNSDESIIKCGTYEGNGGTLEVDLGFEPQWLMIKNADSGGDQYGDADWTVYDIMREFNDQDSKKLHPNLNSIELSGGRVVPTPTGFKIDNESNADININGETHIYVAIRRPHKPPTAGTDVFQSLAFTGAGAEEKATNFPVDLMNTHLTSGGTPYFMSRLQGKERYITTYSNSAEASGAGVTEWGSDYLGLDGSGAGSSPGDSYIHSYFRRAPGFLDVVAFDYPSSNAAITHNLGVTPELIITKARNGAISWNVGSSYLSNTNGWDRYLILNDTDAESSSSTVWNQTAPTSTQFTLGSYPGSSYNGIAYLFATLPGISKVGSYSGTGSDIDVDCGFTAGARFVLIKRLTFTGSWYVWDTTRGIVSGNDPYILLDTTAAQITDQDNIDPINSGFRVVSNLGALNATGSTYLFLAIA
jgi:hypothetical protein